MDLVEDKKGYGGYFGYGTNVTYIYNELPAQKDPEIMWLTSSKWN